MPDSLSTPEPMVLHPQDFDPPLKRKEPTIPGYWTIEEIAAEVGVSVRKVQYDVKGNPQRNKPPRLKAYKAGISFLVPDADALEYIWQYREQKQKS